MIKKAEVMAFLFVVLGLCTASLQAARTIYVDDDATPPGDGASWETAFTYLQDALMVASSGHEIRVAQGIYRPDDFVLSARPNLGREETFQLKDGVTLKGGYTGFGEPDPNARDIELYETILSGDLAGNDRDVNDPQDLLDDPCRAENSYHVVTASGTSETAVLDGFTVTAGNDNRYEMVPSPYPHLRPIGHGAGMCNHSGSPTLTNCKFIRNSANKRGGGMCNENESSPTITNCTFSENIAEGEMATGGGMYNYSSSPILTNCTFSGNSASYEGGGIYNWYSNPNITNCTFIGNSSGVKGGGMYIDTGFNQTLINCIFIDNSAEYRGGAMVVRHCSPTLINCVFKDNKTKSRGGGILCVNEAIPRLINCEFIGNVAQVSGGGMHNTVWSSPTLLNCTFSGNSAGSSGGGVSNFKNSNPTLTNCIIWGNKAPEGPQIAIMEVWDGSDPSTVTVSYSDVQGGEQDVYVGPGCTLIWGEGNIDTDPCFVEPGYWDPNGTPEDANDDNWIDGDYHLKSQAGRWEPNSQSWEQDTLTSPCIDAGDSLSPIGQEPFPNGGLINMGAYGGTIESSKSYFGKPLCETIVAGDVNGDCVVNFLDFRLMALHWCEDNRE